jgi:hypothetical protein
VVGISDPIAPDADFGWFLANVARGRQEHLYRPAAPELQFESGQKAALVNGKTRSVIENADHFRADMSSNRVCGLTWQE